MFEWKRIVNHSPRKEKNILNNLLLFAYVIIIQQTLWLVLYLPCLLYQMHVNEICRKHNVYFFAAGTLGYQGWNHHLSPSLIYVGYFFEDLTTYRFTKCVQYTSTLTILRKPADTESQKVPQEVTINYPTFREVLTTKWNTIRKVSKLVFGVQGMSTSLVNCI